MSFQTFSSINYVVEESMDDISLLLIVKFFLVKLSVFLRLERL